MGLTRHHLLESLISRIQYELLCQNRPELGLPPYFMLDEPSILRLRHSSLEKLVAARSYRILTEGHHPRLNWNSELPNSAPDCLHLVPMG